MVMDQHANQLPARQKAKPPGRQKKAVRDG